MMKKCVLCDVIVYGVVMLWCEMVVMYGVVDVVLDDVFELLCVVVVDVLMYVYLGCDVVLCDWSLCLLLGLRCLFFGVNGVGKMMVLYVIVGKIMVNEDVVCVLGWLLFYDIVFMCGGEFFYLGV